MFWFLSVIEFSARKWKANSKVLMVTEVTKGGTQ
jgi:hypothetical protein